MSPDMNNTLSLTTKNRLVFATNNRHKVDEIRSAIGGTLEVISLKEAGIAIDIPEPHDTLEANASEKSMTIHRLTGMDCFSEDTGLEVAALNGEPGVKSARYAGENSSSGKNIEKLLQKMEGQTDRRARFRTVISLVLDKKEVQFEGVCEGRILAAPAGQDGFGYDPVFAPGNESRSFAEMTMAEKALFSHRRKAADQLIAFLKEHANQPSPKADSAT
jgi:XTP/dITP diphosphohydrolase